MRGYKCQSCDAVVRRGTFCSRCGARQAPRVLRGILAVVGTTAVVAVCAAAFHSLGPSMPERPSSAASGRTGVSECDIGPLDLPLELPPGVSSPFGPTSTAASAPGESRSQSRL